MAGSNHEIDKKLNSSAKPSGLPPANGNKADAALKPKNLLDELESKLDDLFALDEKDAKAAQKRQVIQSPLDEVKAIPKTQKAVTPGIDKADKIKIKIPVPPSATEKKETGIVEPAKAEAAVTLKLKAELSDKFQKKESGKIGGRQGQKKQALLKLAVGGAILGGSILALLIFFKAPAPLDQSRPATVPTAQKIKMPPAKASETKTTPPAVPSVPQRPQAALIKPEPPPAAVSAEEKKPIAPTWPEINAVNEIKDFLQEWKAAWEKSAGEKGDTNAFMSFYSDHFISNGFDKKKWRQDKAEKNRRKEWIRIELDNINIVGPLKNDRYEARFTQVYQSSNYADTSNQVLFLGKEASGWKIIGIHLNPPK